MALHESQKDMLEHSAKKVELLRHYLNEYLPVIGHDAYTDVIHCFDLFCGEGVYPNGGEGSPLVFARLLKGWAARCPGKHFAFHYNDKDAAKVDNVKNRIAEMGQPPPNLHITPSVLPFDQMMQTVRHKIAELGKEKAFLFIDPYGYKEIKPQLIRDLMKGGKTEVLLFLPTQQMFRFSNKGTPEALSDFLELLHDGHGFPVCQSIFEYVSYIVRGFRHFMPDCYVDSFTIRKDSKTAFCLFFFTSNLKGAEKMLEAKWKLDEQQGAGWSYQAGYALDLLIKEADTHPLEKLIESRLRSGPQTNAAIYEATLRAGYLPKQALQILVQMQKDHRIRVSPEGTRAGAFYLNYTATHGANASEHHTITIHLL
jgi:three-Cys-motif partner protein